MIGFLVTNEHRYTIEILAEDWVPALRQWVKVLPYEFVRPGAVLPPATYIFSDLERLSDPALELAKGLYERSAGQPGIRMLNDPSRSLRRFDLLRSLREQRVNGFDVYRLTETTRPSRWPVFLRAENDHGGNVTPLLHSREELEGAVAQLQRTRGSLRHLLMVEFVDASGGTGVFKKYGAQVVGSHVIPKHLFFSEGWMVKRSEIVGPTELEQEEEYIATNPHQAQLRRIFSLAGIAFGRVDYGIAGGDVQVWEINTNPILLPPRGRADPARRALKERVSASLREAFAGIDGPDPDPSAWEDLLDEPRFNLTRSRQVLKRRVGSNGRLRRIYRSSKPAGRRIRLFVGTLVSAVARLVGGRGSPGR